MCSAKRSSRLVGSGGALALALDDSFEPGLSGRLVLFGGDDGFHRLVEDGDELVEGEVKRLVGEALGPGQARAGDLEVALRPGFELGFEGSSGDDLVDQPDAVRLLGIDVLAAQDQVAGV